MSNHSESSGSDADAISRGAVTMLADISERKRAERMLRRSEAWLAGQKEAFQGAVNGAPLETSLGALVRTAIGQLGDDARCAFYIADASGAELHHVTGMSEAYARCVSAFGVGPESPACGLATHTGYPVITPDVAEAPLWRPWLWLAEEHGYRGCWAFPIETSTGKFVGTVAMYFKKPRDASPCDLELAGILTRTAAIIISRHQEAEERARAEKATAASEARLAKELAAAQRLQAVSTSLIQEGDTGALYLQILDAAIEVMHSDMASLQMLEHERGELRLLAWKGFDPASAAFWEWVGAGSSSSCGAALSSGRRIIVQDTETCTFLAGTDDLAHYRRSKIRAVQSTPLLSRDGGAVGMISTHWREPHEPTDHDLRLFDVLARQAADLIERAQAIDTLRHFNATLDAQVRERTRELETAMEERRKAEIALQQAQRLEAIGQLTGGVAHDFNNILTVVVGHAGAIQATVRDAHVTRMAAAIQRAAERGAQLTGQLLAFSRRQQLRPVTVSFDRLVANIDDLVRRAVGETVAVQFSADPGLWPTVVDPAQFESALLNLALNARDAMPDGGKLTIAARNAIVAEAEAARLDLIPGDYMVVRVGDTGSGMSPDVRERAFEPFFTTKDVGKGTGLGLAQIYGFTKQSNGAATIESTLGRGTTVSLYLPRADVPATDEEPLPGPPPATSTSTPRGT